MQHIHLICIGCPLGCPLEAQMENGQVLSVRGNTCKIGEKYAHKELSNPTRIVTSTVRVVGGTAPTVPVKTASDIPKDKILECVRALKRVWAVAPVKIGDVILSNVAGTGIDIVATKNVTTK